MDIPTRLVNELHDVQTEIDDLETRLAALKSRTPIPGPKPGAERKVRWVPVIVVLIGLIGGLIVLIPPLVETDPTPTPPSSFEYAAKVEDRVTGKPIPNAQITIEVINQAPLHQITDSGGNARFFVNPERSGQPGRLIIQATGYERYTQNIDLIPDQLPNVVRLATS